MYLPKYLTKHEVAEYVSSELGLPLSGKTLSKYISQGGGPKYQKFGRRVVYTEENLRN